MEPTAGLDQAATTALVKRYFTTPGQDPFDTVEWETRDAWTPESPYYRPNLEVPKTWSDNALGIVSKLYLANAAEYKETSIRQLIERVASQYAIEAVNHGYFPDLVIPAKYAEYRRETNDYAIPRLGDRLNTLALYGNDSAVMVFYDELCFILLHQLAAFNSPVWFNIGRPDRPQQASACFVLSVDDTTQSIMDTARREAFIFKGGSGSGFDISRLRGSMESLSTGGTASGPVSFMRMWDAGAGTFKSGGTTRRAAKLVKCDVDHPDIRDFIGCKVREEERLKILAAAGLDIGFSMEGERNVAEVTSFQNANNSVGVTDEFMRKAMIAPGYDSNAEGEIPGWLLQHRTSDHSEDNIVDDARDLLRTIAHAAWECADPGMLYMDRINRMHTTPVLDGINEPIRSSNPCGEFLSNDDTSCNLGSINVLKFLGSTFDGETSEPYFKIQDYRQVVDVMTTAMDVSICFADFPDPVIADRTRKLRQLGLGYSNMGAAIMAQGMAYDSDEARDFAASVTALNTGRAYRQSARIAEVLEPFHYFEENRHAMHTVIANHIGDLRGTGMRDLVWDAAQDDWLEAKEWGWDYGFRNAQASVLAPAGTISFLMDCDTTGVEPAFALVSHKQLAGGGSMVLVNQSVRRAAQMLGGYSDDNLKAIDSGDFVPTDEDAPVFHTANEISWQAHVKMVAAVQPFVSGGISKTINMDEGVTVDEVREAYVLAWKLGVKDIALYRNNSKARQVLAGKPKEQVKVEEAAISEEAVLSMMDTMRRQGIVDLRSERQRRIYDEASQRLDRESKGTDVEPSLDKEIAQQVPKRNRMPRTRDAKTHKIHVKSAMAEHEGYVMAGVYEDGRIGEIFIEGFGKQGSFAQNALAAWATDASIGWQYGVPLDVWCRKHAFVSDETGGVVVPDQSGVPLVLTSCKSITDYIARWIAAEFGDADLCEELGIMTPEVKRRKAEAMGLYTDMGDVPETPIGVLDTNATANGNSLDIKLSSNGHSKNMGMGQTCGTCGGAMRRTGACFTCPSCGSTSGCG